MLGSTLGFYGIFDSKLLPHRDECRYRPYLPKKPTVGPKGLHPPYACLGCGLPQPQGPGTPLSRWQTWPLGPRSSAGAAPCAPKQVEAHEQPLLPGYQVRPALMGTRPD